MHMLLLYIVSILQFTGNFGIYMYLLSKPNIGCKKPISLAINCWSSTPTNRIHFPMSVIIVHYMKISMPAPVQINSPQKQLINNRILYVYIFKFLKLNIQYIYLGILCTKPSPK